jgi:hypothetical protein
MQHTNDKIYLMLKNESYTQALASFDKKKKEYDDFEKR